MMPIALNGEIPSSFSRNPQLALETWLLPEARRLLVHDCCVTVCVNNVDYITVPKQHGPGSHW